jgi:SAM-dependent methyltransferase
MDAAGPNAEQITYWNEQTGTKWVAAQPRLDAMILPFGAAAMDALAPAAGERIVDVGCGCGDTSLALGRRVTATGGVLGVDVSEPMLARARERAAAEGAAHVRFVRADAQTHPFERGAADGVFSRFGVMFFADPTAAFTNLRGALRAGGRLSFVCWQPATENPWVLVPLMAVAGLVPLPPPPAPDAPGPFALGDRDRLARILRDAGFRDVAIQPFTPEVTIGGGGTLDDAVQFAMQLGPTGVALRDADPAVLAGVTGAIELALRPYATPRGVVMPSSAWTVTARA